MNKQSDSHRPQIKSAETEQRHCIIAADLAAICLRNVGRIEPGARLHVILERIIDREQQAIGPERENRVDQRLSAKIAAGRHIKILPEIVTHGAFRRPTWHLGESVIEPPQIVRNALAEMTYDNLQLWIKIEQARAH